MADLDRPVVVFDLGNVLIDWNPRYLYRKIFDGDEEKVSWFLENVATADWNASFDAGRPMADGIAEKSAEHPDHKDAIAAWQGRWIETIKGPIDGSVAILETLNDSGVTLHAITNWSAETFPLAKERFAFLGIFQTITVSGEVGLIKPGREIFDLFAERTGVQPGEAVFIDDSRANIETASALGFDAIHFTSADDLRSEMAKRFPDLSF
ncbi:MAG: HAD family phosphatase [Pseudomonadota bacterium]